MEAQEEEEKVYVLVPKKSRDGMSVLLWVLRNAPKSSKIVITHVYQLEQMIPAPFGGRVHPDMASPLEVAAFRQKEKATVIRKLDDYVRECSKAQFKLEKLAFGSSDVAKGILELIAIKGIKKLVMGAAEDRHYSMRMVEPTSSKAKSVMNKADPSCKIWFVCKGNLIYTREANQGTLWANQEQSRSPSLLLPGSNSLSSAMPREQIYTSSSGTSPGISYRISSDTQSLCTTEADAARCADIELQDALADLTLIVRKVEDSVSRQKQGTEQEVESLKFQLNEKEMLLQQTSKQNLELQACVRELEENVSAVSSCMLSLQTEHIQLRSEGEQNLKLLQEITIQKLVIEECFKGLGDSLAAVKGPVELLSLWNRQQQQE